MLIYQIRPRIFRLNKGERVVFPADVEIRFHFKPDQPFGMTPGGGKTTVRSTEATVLFNANTGAHTIEAKTPLDPLDVTIEETPTRTAQFNGNVLTIKQHFNTIDEVHEAIQSIYFTLPSALNISFGEPPIIEQVDGQIGLCAFRWELANWHVGFWVTDQKKQEAAASKAWLQMTRLAKPTRRRLFAALHYFHVACRLSRQGDTPGEFLPEVILNLAKTLEVLFPSAESGKAREAARSGLRELGFSEDEIEGNLIPAMVVRNELDVGHVQLGLFKADHLKILHAYTERAENAFRDMLERVLEGLLAGNFEVSLHELATPSREALKVIERLKQYTPDNAI